MASPLKNYSNIILYLLQSSQATYQAFRDAAYNA